MATTPSRRAIVAGLAVGSAELAPFVRATKPAAAAEATGPIELAYREYVRLARISEAAFEAMYDAEDRFEEPERPGWHPVLTEGGYDLVRTGDGRTGRAYVDMSVKNVERLQAIVAQQQPDDEDERVWHDRRVERAKATLASIRDWQAESRRRSDAVGLTAAAEASRAAGAKEKAQALKVFEMEPTSFRELGCQAAILRVDWFADKVDKVLENLVRLSGISGTSNEG